MLFSVLLSELKKLDLPKDGFAVFGSGPLAVRGLRETDDLDLIARAGLWDQLARTHKPNGVEIRIGNISVYRDWKPWFDEPDVLIDTADLIDGIRYVNLGYAIQCKKARGREKDMKDVAIIEDFLKRQ